MNRRHDRTKGVLAMLLVAASLPILGTPIRGTPQTPYMTFPSAGGDWLQWDKRQREIFVAGFITGHSLGAHDGCLTHDTNSGRTTWCGR
jgi:hypothetical protein